MEKLGRSYQLLSWKINAGELALRELLDRANDSERKPTRERSQLERETNSEKKTSLQTPACLTRCVPEKKTLAIEFCRDHADSARIGKQRGKTSMELSGIGNNTTYYRTA